MKNTILYITGTSSGIGKALALAALNKGARVIGFSRTCTITHSLYTHKTLDLSSHDIDFKNEFKLAASFDRIVLINNAGTLGEIKPLGDISKESISKSIQLNLTTPFLFINEFVRVFKNSSQQKFILNITSGAANNAYDGWSEYCTTKAGINMLTKVVVKELELQGEKRFTVFGASPGVVETNMQSQIRGASESAFSSKDKFIEMHENKINKTPEQSANELLDLVENPNNYHGLFPDFWQG